MDLKDRIVYLYQIGRSLEKVAELVGRSDVTVRAVLRKRKIPLRKLPEFVAFYCPTPWEIERQKALIKKKKLRLKKASEGGRPRKYGAILDNIVSTHNVSECLPELLGEY